MIQALRMMMREENANGKSPGYKDRTYSAFFQKEVAQIPTSPECISNRTIAKTQEKRVKKA